MKGVKGWRLGSGVPLCSQLVGLGERHELPQPDPWRSLGCKLLFNTFQVSQNALGEKKMQYFCLIW